MTFLCTLNMQKKEHKIYMEELIKINNWSTDLLNKANNNDEVGVDYDTIWTYIITHCIEC